MNPAPSDDELVRRYHAASAFDSRRPSGAVADAVRAHARMVVGDTTVQTPVGGAGVAPARGAANAARWRLSVFGSLAVIGLAGLLVLQFDRGTSQERELAQTPDVPARRTAAVPETATVAAPSAARQQPARDEALALQPIAPVRKSALEKSPGLADGPTPTPVLPAAQAQPAAAAPAAALVAPPVAGPGSGGPSADADAQSSQLADRDGEQESGPARRRAPVPGPSARADAAAGLSLAPTAPGAAAASARPKFRPGSLPAIGASSALHRIAAEGRVAELAPLLAAGAPIDAVDTVGRTPLMVAASAGRREMVQRLLDAGANPALADHARKTARQHALNSGWPEVARLLGPESRDNDDSQR